MFYSYRPISVWSAPEVLKQPKKILEPLTPMDVYSFGMLMWEIFHEKVPFDGDTAACTKLVKEDARPKISLGEEENNQFYCTAPIANIIRKCWDSDAFERPNFNWVIEQLN